MGKFFRAMVFPGRNTWTCGLGFLAVIIAGSLIRLWSGSSVWALVGGFLIGCIVSAITWQIEARHFE